MQKIIFILAAFAVSAPVAYAQMSDDEGMDHENMAAEQSDMPMDHDNMAIDGETIEGAVHTKATINSFGEGAVNVSHDPIPAIGWPAMTMDMPLAEDVKMTDDLNVGDQVVMTLAKGEDGMYAVRALMAEK